VGQFAVGDSSLLHEVLIDTDETNSVTARYIGDSLDLAAHHEDGTLDVLDVQVVLAAGLVVGSHDTDFLASGDGTAEDTTESVETALVVGRDHLGDEDHEGTIPVAFGDGFAARVIGGSLIKVSSSVLLRLLGRGELHDNHLNESVSGVNPLLEDALEEGLALVILLISLEDESDVVHHLFVNLFVSFHERAGQLDDGSHDELDEAPGELATLTVVGVGGELLVGGVEVVVSPEFLHELLTVELELLGEGKSELGKGEGPSEESGTEGDGTA